MPNLSINVDDLIDFASIVNDGNVPIVNQHGLHGALSSYHYYNTIELQIGCVFRSILLNHSFMDGNKRVAVLFLLTMCQVHNLTLKCTDDQLFNIVMMVIKHKPNVEQLITYLF